MGDPVAVAALRELGHNALGMLITMAILAFRHGFVFVLMTECAGKCSVFRLRRRQEAVGILVAGCAHFVRCLGSIGNVLGHMRLMALQAVRYRHIRGMGFMALRACRYFSVNFIVTGGAEQGGVFALILSQLFYLRRVAGKAWLRQVSGE
jgi:hypothetical protein